MQLDFVDKLLANFLWCLGAFDHLGKLPLLARRFVHMFLTWAPGWLKVINKISHDCT